MPRMPRGSQLEPTILEQHHFLGVNESAARWIENKMWQQLKNRDVIFACATGLHIFWPPSLFKSKPLMFASSNHREKNHQQHGLRPSYQLVHCAAVPHHKAAHACTHARPVLLYSENTRSLWARAAVVVVVRPCGLPRTSNKEELLQRVTCESASAAARSFFTK